MGQKITKIMPDIVPKPALEEQKNTIEQALEKIAQSLIGDDKKSSQ